MLGIRELPVHHPDEVIDLTDRKTIFTHIIQQAIHDYVTLAYPATRIKKYLQEHYLNAVDFLFDPTYELAYVEDDNERPMKVAEMVGFTMDTTRDLTPQLQAHAIKSAIEYWEQKTMPPLDHIPETVYIEGQVFNVEHAYIKRYTVDLESRTITLDKNIKQDNNLKNFLEAVIYTTALIKDLDVKASIIRELSDSMYSTLKVNACFNDMNVAPIAQLFKEIRHE